MFKRYLRKVAALFLAFWTLGPCCNAQSTAVGSPVQSASEFRAPAISKAAVDDVYDHSPWLLIGGGIFLILLTRWRKHT
jgi:hypothetical protein